MPRFVVQITVLLLSPLLWAGDGSAQASTCLACHGRDGQSVTRQWPSLAGLGRDYIAKQMNDYKTGKRIHPVMEEMAVDMDQAEIFAVASALADLQPKSARAEDALGARIFSEGLPERGIPPCAPCHGPKGEGRPLLSMPGLAGQRPEYLKRQLLAFRKGTRTNDNGMMAVAVAGLTYAEVKAVVAWLAGDYPRVL